MTAPAPIWMTPEFLPELQIVRSESYDLMRAEHLRLVDALRRPQAPRLRRTFSVEDEFVEDAERKGIAPRREITPPTVRRDRLAEAEAQDADALRALCRQVVAVVEWVFSGVGDFDGDGALLSERSELRQAIAAARVEAGYDTAPSEEEEGATEIYEETNYAFPSWRLMGPVEPKDIDEFNAKAEVEAQAVRATDAKHWRQRRALGADLEALSTLRQSHLSAYGANLLADVGRICPEALAGSRSAGMGGAQLAAMTRAA